jgi:serine/threonine protein kinase
MQPLPATGESRRFGKYTLVAKLAQGGMAEIFLARLGGAAGFEKLVCIKRILPSYAQDAGFVSMFLDEARIAARISHPNVCQVYELGSLEGQYYIAMEYLEGVPVAAFRRRERYPTPPDPRLVVGIAMQACEGLHHAHQLRGPDGQPLEVVHRDISPQNLFATADGIVKVLDFGIAKMHNASQKTTTGTVKGTYAYMPPEQLRGERVDRRSDVFAMGAVVWELLARRHLFRRETDFLTFQAITTDPIPDVCTFRPDVPDQIGVVITRALARDREERWPTIRAFGEALLQACLPVGGPLSPAAIGEEVVRAFGDSLEEQRTMLEIARAGGEFDLEESSAASFGMLEIATTPVSSLKRRSEALRIPTAPPSAMLSVVAPRPSLQMPIAPAPRSRLWLLVALLLLAAGGGAGIVYYAFVYRHNEPAPAPAVVAEWASPAGSGSQAAPAAAPRDPAASTAAGVDAAVPEPVDAGVVEPLADAGVASKEAPHPPRPTRQAKAPPPPQPPQPPATPPPAAGPAGSITIDSTPVYAVIFIDGKRYGETPLIDIKLPPGKHAVRAVSSSGGTQNLTITIESGKRARGRRIEW